MNLSHKINAFFASLTLASGLIFSVSTLAAPHPLTGSSILSSPSNSLAFSQMGFSVDNIPQFWNFNKPIAEKAKSLELGPQGKTLLSFRMENVSLKTSLEPYVRQYLRDYNQYGFEVAGVQSIVRNEVPFVIVDLNQKNKLTKTRQVFYHNKDRMIIATCSDEVIKFESTLQVCNSILGTFSWDVLTTEEPLTAHKH